MKSQYKNKIVCPECGKKNCAVFDDGHHHCFTMDCGYTYYPNKKEKKVTTKIIPIYKPNPKLLKVTPIALPKRGITKETSELFGCLLYTSPSPRDLYRSRMPSSA